MFAKYYDAAKAPQDKESVLSDLCAIVADGIAKDTIQRPLASVFTNLSKLSGALGERFDCGVESFCHWIDLRSGSFFMPDVLAWKDSSAIIKNLPATFQWKVLLDLQAGGKRAHFFPASHKADILPVNGTIAANIATGLESDGFVTFVYAMDDGIGRRIMWLNCEGQLSVNGIAGYRQGSVEQIFRLKK